MMVVAEEATEMAVAVAAAGKVARSRPYYQVISGTEKDIYSPIFALVAHSLES